MSADFPECVGCGYCCIKIWCILAQVTYSETHSMSERCPALLWNGERYVCDLADEYGDFLYIDCGCTSSLNSWRQDVKERVYVGE